MEQMDSRQLKESAGHYGMLNLSPTKFRKFMTSSEMIQVKVEMTSKGGDGFKICQNYGQAIGRVIDVSFDLNKVLEKNIHLAVEDARGVKNKTVLKSALIKLIEGIRNGNLQDDDINSIIVQLEDYIIEGD